VATEKRELFNGTMADEQEVLAACLARLHLGERQVVRALTRSGLQIPNSDERMLAYLRENLDGLLEETLTDFLVKNREPHPVEPNFNPGGRLVCVGDEEFEHIFRDGMDGPDFAGSSLGRMGRSGSRGSGSTGTSRRRYSTPDSSSTGT